MKYTKEILEIAVKNSKNTSEVVRKLCGCVTGSRHRHIKQRIMYYGIDISHFTVGNCKVAPSIKLTTDSLFVDNRTGRRESANVLRKFMISVGFIEECSECKIKEWNGKSITLQVDHKNGNGLDNTINNIRFLCPNCHSQTDNFGSKKLKQPEKPKKIRKPHKTKIDWPNDEELSKLVWEIPPSKLAVLWDISDTAISDRCKIRKINKPGRGYWAKIYSKQ